MQKIILVILPFLCLSCHEIIEQPPMQETEMVRESRIYEVEENSITIDVEEWSFAKIMQEIEAIAGTRIVYDSSAKKITVTTKLSHLSWLEALEKIAREHDYVVQHMGMGVIKVSRKYQSLQTKIFPLRHIHPDRCMIDYDPIPFSTVVTLPSLAKLERSRPEGCTNISPARCSSSDFAEVLHVFTSPKIGKIVYDEDSNALVITDTPEKLKQLAKIVRHFDSPQKMLCKGTLIRAAPKRLRDLGVHFADEKAFSLFFLDTPQTESILAFLATDTHSYFASSPEVMVGDRDEAAFLLGERGIIARTRHGDEEKFYVKLENSQEGIQGQLLSIATYPQLYPIEKNCEMVLTITCRIATTPSVKIKEKQWFASPQQKSHDFITDIPLRKGQSLLLGGFLHEDVVKKQGSDLFLLLEMQKINGGALQWQK